MSRVEQNEKLAKTFSALKYAELPTNAKPDQPAAKKLLDIPLLDMNAYCTESAKYNCITDWNHLQKIFFIITSGRMHIYVTVKTLLKRQYLENILKYLGRIHLHSFIIALI